MHCIDSDFGLIFAHDDDRGICLFKNMQKRQKN